MTFFRRVLRIAFLSLLCVFGSVMNARTGFADTLRVVTNNALDFNGQSNANRVPYFRTVMRAIQPDVVMMEEMGSEQAMDFMLAQVYAQLDTDWTTANFMAHGSLNCVCYYRMSKVALVSQRAIPTDLRDIDEFVLRPATGDTTVRLHIYSTHLKAGNSSDEAAQRQVEVTVMRGVTNALPAGTNFLMCGDFNVYGASEAAYQTLITAGANANGQFYDPLNRPGEWHDSGMFADIHTQSTRVADLGDGGATGGLDDRFDFILVSAALMDTAGSYVIPSSYHSFGNDGAHLNRAINDGTNSAVPDSVAYALCHATDHLPVVVDMVLREEAAGTTLRPQSPQAFALFTCYPNPFNPVLTINLPAASGKTNVTIYDVLGRRIFEHSFREGAAVSEPLQVDFSRFGTGTYFVQLRQSAASQVQRVSYVR